MRFRSKPVEVDAIQFLGDESIEEMRVSWGSRFDDWMTSCSPTHIAIKTLEGYMEARLNDWIIRGTEDEFYPCKDSVFQRKYEVLISHENHPRPMAQAR